MRGKLRCIVAARGEKGAGGKGGILAEVSPLPIYRLWLSCAGETESRSTSSADYFCLLSCSLTNTGLTSTYPNEMSLK